MGKSCSAVFAAAVACMAQQGLAEPVSPYQAGVVDRGSFEQWYAGLTGDYRGGAMYWVAHRSSPSEARCPAEGDQAAGCLAAQQKLGPFDTRRKGDANYRLGWNAALTPGLAAREPSSNTAAARLATEPIYHVQHDTFGCLNPSDTLVLSNPLEQRRSDTDWVGSFTKDRQCVPISPRSPWKLVRHDGDVALMAYAGSSSPPGSFYLRESDLALPASVDTAASPPREGGGDHPSSPPADNDVRRPTPVAMASTAIASAMTAWAARTFAGVLLNVADILVGAAALLAAMLLLRYLATQAERRAAQARRNRAIAVALADIAAKAHLLHVRREQLTQPDFYGTRNLRAWEKEKAHFADTRLVPLLDQHGFGDLAAAVMPILFNEIEAAAVRPMQAAAPCNFASPQAYQPGMDPLQYEIHCAQLLQTAGWVTQATPKTGDQGADIVAERHGTSLVVQCKLYSSNVGNGAVQEAAAARLFHKTQLAVVVSNAAFTKAARQLAGMSDVTLLHHSQLPAYVGRPAPTEVIDAAD